MPATLRASLDTATRSAEADARIRRAEELFQAGRRLYHQGDMEAARAEFDRAIDILMAPPAGMADKQRLETKSQQLVEAIYSYDVEALNGGEASQEPVYDKSPLDDILEMTFPIDPKLKARVKEEVQATVSQLPLEVNDSVLRYINYFSSTRGRKVLVAGLERAGRYRPMIQRILDEEGLPQELTYLAQAESGFLPRAVSRKKATGMWQFVQFRGREYGLMQTRDTDDRLDPEKATRAAARHLRDLYGQFGDWYLAMAAYNSGPVRVASAVERTGYADFWELSKRGVLPRETANYLPIILAMTIMAKNAKDYGLEGVVPQPPIEYDTIEVTASTHLSLIADILDRPLSEIKELNPAVLKNVAPASYAVRVPKGSAGTLTAALESIPAPRRASWRVHRVESGQTLTEIARLYRTSTRAIAEANGGAVEDPEAGDVLVIPVSYPAPRTASSEATRRKPARSASGVKRTSSAPAPKKAQSTKATSLRASQQRHTALQP